ncbi:MAG: hypothetical protein NC912_01255 [Candidatus Omnitrophica bacterium]|nr:hypothetical protein [Candidatus Omnitrophota bacterium]
MILFVIFNIGGCTTVSKKDASLISSTNPLEPSAMLKFTDIPYPSGFTLIPNESYVFETAGVRVGLLKYQGKADVERIINFYKEQMLMYDWHLLNVVEYGQRLMNFERENETCIINILPKGRLITISILLGPKSQVFKKSKESKIK